MLPKTYFPAPETKKIATEDQIVLSREAFEKERPNNLTFLLANRFEWMNEYLSDADKVVELGAGGGYSRFFLECPGLILTDVFKFPWIDTLANALDPPFEDDSLDALICSHMIHHLAHPVPFFRMIRQKLKIGGVLIIQDLHSSFLLKVLLRLKRHEGWSYEVDVFDPELVANDPGDPWSANCAIPDLLFRDEERFQRSIPGFAIEKNELNECLTFPLSGGVNIKTKTVELPIPVLRFIYFIDRILIAVAPNVFALGRSVVLRRTS